MKCLSCNIIIWSFLGGTEVKNPPANARNTKDVSSILNQEDPWRRKQQPALVFLPGKFHGQGCLEGYSHWGVKESDMTEPMCAHACARAHTHIHTHCTLPQMMKESLVMSLSLKI